MEAVVVMSTLPRGQFLVKHIRPLGEGGLGTVDEIEVSATNCSYGVGQRFARKRLNAKWKRHPQAVERFEREIAATRTMSHSNIVGFRGENTIDGNERFYLMDVYPGSLRTKLFATPGGYRWDEVARFGLVIANALAYAHSMGNIHRDLKPENVLFTADNVPIIADWGLGYFVHKESRVLHQLTRGGMGTEYYCSIEQWTTGKCTFSGDVYSLGVVLAELVTGRQVPMRFPGDGIQYTVAKVGDAGALMFNQLLATMTRVTATTRIQTMAEVSRGLQTALDLMGLSVGKSASW